MVKKKESGTTVKFETNVINSSLYDYSEVYILVTGEIKRRHQQQQ